MCWAGMRQRRQRGTVLIEAAVAIPLLAMLIMTAVTIFFWAVRSYFVQLADVELEQEVQMAFERLMGEAMKSEKIYRLTDSHGYAFVKKQDPLKIAKYDKPSFASSYWLHKMSGVDKLVSGDNDAPMTGDHALANVTITVFNITQDKEKPGIYHLQLTGKSLVTEHEYSLSSAVYLPAEDKKSDVGLEEAAGGSVSDHFVPAAGSPVSGAGAVLSDLAEQ